MERFLADIFDVRAEDPDTAAALTEARRAILDITTGSKRSVELAPQNARVRRMQHELAREANLASYSTGTEPTRRVTVHDTR